MSYQVKMNNSDNNNDGDDDDGLKVLEVTDIDWHPERKSDTQSPIVFIVVILFLVALVGGCMHLTKCERDPATAPGWFKGKVVEVVHDAECTTCTTSYVLLENNELIRKTYEYYGPVGTEVEIWVDRRERERAKRVLKIGDEY